MTETQSNRVLNTAALIFAALTLAGLVLLQSGCATTSGQAAGRIAFDVATKCAVPAVGQEAMNLADTLRAALGAADWTSQIARLEALGADAVVCAISQVFSDLAAYHALSQSTTRGATVDIREIRAAAYLKAHGVSVQVPSS